MPCINAIMQHEFSDSKLVAMKCLMGCLIPAIESSPEFNPYIIWLCRNLEDQARSLSKVHDGQDWINPQILKWLQECDEWLREFVLNSCCSPVLKIQFEEILDHPIREATKIREFLNLKPGIEACATSWVNPEFFLSRGKYES